MGHHLFKDRVHPGGVTGFYNFLFGFLSRSLWLYRYNFALDGLVSTFPEILRCFFG